MKRIQRRMAEGIDVVTEGRDQGSVVFPQAELKVFLTASPEERARRRHREELGRGHAPTLESVLESQSRRDDADCARPVGAMRQADDAVLLETDGLSAEEVVQRLAELAEACRRRLEQP
jgi:cytidylate kinase